MLSQYVLCSLYYYSLLYIFIYTELFTFSSFSTPAPLLGRRLVPSCQILPLPVISACLLLPLPCSCQPGGQFLPLPARLPPVWQGQKSYPDVLFVCMYICMYVYVYACLEGRKRERERDTGGTETHIISHRHYIS